MIAPCRDCQERTPECHGCCERYKAYRAAKDKETQNRGRERDAAVATILSTYRMKERNPAKRKS